MRRSVHPFHPEPVAPAARGRRRRPSRAGPWAALLAIPVAALFVINLPVGVVPTAPSPHPLAAVPSVARNPVDLAKAPGLRPAGPNLGGEVELRADARDPAAFPNQGAETNLTAFTPVSLPPGAKFQVSVVEIIGAYQAVFGIFQNSTSIPVAFYELFNNTSEALVRYVYWPFLILQSGTSYLFGLVYQTAGKWEFFVDHRPFDDNATIATVDLGTSEATWSSGLSWAVSMITPEAIVPPSVNAPLAFATYQAGRWYLPHLAIATNVGTPGSPWGIEGAQQHPTLAPGEVATGAAIAPLATGSPLWNGPPQPIAISVNVTPSVVPANGFAQVAVTTSRPGGPALPGVFVQLTDSAGSSFEPATVQTGPTGTGSTVLHASNASATQAETLVAVSTLFGFTGNGSTPVTITAVQRVFFDAPNEVTVSPSHTIGIAFRAVAANGSALASLPIAFGVNASASVLPEGALTDGNGSIVATVHAPGAPAQLYLTANVVGAGFWGATHVVVMVKSPPTPWYDLVLPYLGYGVLALAAAALVYLLLVRIRRRPTPLPPFPRVRRPATPKGSPPGGPPAQP